MSSAPAQVHSITAALEAAILADESNAGGPPAAELTAVYTVVDQFGTSVTVGVSGDGLDLVCVGVGCIDDDAGRHPALLLVPGVARKIAVALLKAADDAEVAGRRYAV